MKITEIDIERFGVWRDLRLKLSHPGLNVFYGPNEAGKSTLMRFIRGVLFGFDPSRGDFPDRRNRPMEWSGRLALEQDDKTWQISRRALPGSRGVSSAWSDEGDLSPELLLQKLLPTVDEAVFQRVFAVGLNELQELATLQGEEVARHIYGMSLGPVGQKLLDVIQDSSLESRQWYDPEERQGELLDLLKQHANVGKELKSVNVLREQYAKYCRERDDLERGIAAKKQRQVNIHSDLRGYAYLEKVWGPWKAHRDLKLEYQRLPASLDEFPVNGIEQLDERDTEIASAVRYRETLSFEISELRKKCDSLKIGPETRRLCARMKSFVDQREDVVEALNHVRAAAQRVEGLRTEIDQRLKELGPEWNDARLERGDFSLSSHFRLTRAAKSYQAALAKRATLSKKYRRRHDASQQMIVQFQERTKSLNGQTIQDTIAIERKKLADLAEAGRLRLRAAELEERIETLREQVRRSRVDFSLPNWVHPVLMGFGIFGAVFVLMGLFYSMTSAWVAGFAYVFLGATSGGLAWALRTHFEASNRSVMDQLRRELRTTELKLFETREAIRARGAWLDAEVISDSPVRNSQTALSSTATVASTTALSNDSTNSRTSEQRVEPGTEERRELRGVLGSGMDRAQLATTVDGPKKKGLSRLLGEGESNEYGRTGNISKDSPQGDRQRSPVSDSDRVTAITARISELEALARQERKIQNIRKRLSEQRGILRRVQRSFGEARHQWCEALIQLGLNETLKISEAMDIWQKAAVADERRRMWLAASNEQQEYKRRVQAFRVKIQDLSRRYPERKDKFDDLAALLASWENEVRSIRDRISERQRLKQELKKRRHEAVTLRTQIATLKTSRKTLLQRGGAETREEFERRSAQSARRRELEELIAVAKEDLDQATRTEPNLAIVEEDLIRYEPAKHQELVQGLHRELKELDQDLEKHFEKLGSVKQWIKTLEADRRSTHFRQTRSQLRGKIQGALSEWFSAQMAAGAVEQLRIRYEKTCQPDVLAAASRFLHRLTSGRYVNVWTPLGKQKLCVDDDLGRSFGVEQLSQGTREQLFLAIRLALVDEFDSRGISVPLVLDDVLVNFDQLRTEAAVSTLQEFAGDKQQVLLFTCHLHLAHLFQSRGIEPVWLPGHEIPLEERMAG